MRYPLTLCLLLAATCAVGDTYRWTDSAGRTVVSDTPPPGKTNEVRRAVENFPVTLYTSADCVSECKQAREFLNGRGVPFTEKMVQTPEEVAELKGLVGDTFVPSLKVGNQRFRGFETGAYDNLLDLAGYPKTTLKSAGGQGK